MAQYNQYYASQGTQLLAPIPLLRGRRLLRLPVRRHHHHLLRDPLRLIHAHICRLNLYICLCHCGRFQYIMDLVPIGRISGCLWRFPRRGYSTAKHSLQTFIAGHDNGPHAYRPMSLPSASPVFVCSSERCEAHAATSRPSFSLFSQKDQCKGRPGGRSGLGEDIDDSECKSVPSPDNREKVYCCRRGRFYYCPLWTRVAQERLFRQAFLAGGSFDICSNAVNIPNGSGFSTYAPPRVSI
jgi:hypothetical protein